MGELRALPQPGPDAALPRPALELVGADSRFAVGEQITLNDQTYVIEARDFPDTLTIAQSWVGRDVLVEAVDQEGSAMHGRPYDAAHCQARWNLMDPGLARIEVGRQRRLGTPAMFAPFVGQLVAATPIMRKIMLEDGERYTGFFRNTDRTPTHRLSRLSKLDT